MPRFLIEGCNFILSVEWFRNSSSDGRHPTTSSRPLRVPVLISSRCTMSPVIGQRIALSEKWPGIFVVAERGNDFETRAAGGKGVDEDERREERGTWTSAWEPVSWCASARARRSRIHAYSSLLWALSCECLRGRSRCNTRVVPCMHVHAVCNARNRYSPIEIR